MGPVPPHRHPHPIRGPIPGAALRHRLAVRLGWIGGARPVRLSGGRSATTIRLGRGTCAVVMKLARAARSAPHHGARITEPTRARATHPAPPTTTRHATDPGSALFAIDPALEGRVMAALVRRGLTPKPTAMFRHGPHVCLAYPFQRGRAGHPPGAALARLLRHLHGLPPAALPPLPAAQDTSALVARAVARLLDEPDGPALVARIDAAAMAARHPFARGKAPLHGDPVPGNVLIGPRGARLIDWHSAHRGDACHDLALALSPAMQVIHGLPPCTASRRNAFLAAYGCRATRDRLNATAALHHARMIGHCLWRLDRGDAAYGPACAAEIAALRAL